MIRQLLAIKLIVVLLAPWIAALSGVAAPVVPCPMHRVDGVTGHDHAMAGLQHEGAQHHSGLPDGTSARGCNCAGECGRIDGAFTLPFQAFVRAGLSVTAEAVIADERPAFASAARLLPLATGPPQRLQT